MIGGLRAMRDGDAVVLHELPRRPCAPAHRGLRRPRLRRLRGARPALVALRLPDRVRRRAARAAGLRPDDLRHTFGADRSPPAGLRQLRIAETEKYAHVTFFFNGGREEPFAGEERILVPTPRSPPTTCSRR